MPQGRPFCEGSEEAGVCSLSFQKKSLIFHFIVLTTRVGSFSAPGDCRRPSLVDTDHFPPNRADTQECGDVEDRETEADLPPGGEGHVASAEERRRGSDAVMSGATHDVGEDAENEGRHKGRGAARDEHGKEGGVHGTNVRRTGGEHVVGVEVEEHNHEEGWLPCEAGGGNNLHNGRGEPRDEAVLVKVASHGDEGCEPGEGIPGGSLSEALLPGDDAGDEQGGEANERGGDGADTKLGAEDPEGNGDGESASHDLLVAGHGTKLRELFLGLERSLGGVLHLGGVEHVEDEGHSDEANEAGNRRGESPLAPGDGLADGGGGEVHRQRVGSHRGDEHTGGDGGCLEHGGHDVSAHLLLGALLGFRAARDAESLGEGQEDAASTRREGGNGGREQSLRKDQRVGQAKRGLAEEGNDVVGDAVAETSLDETARQEEGERDEPGNLRREGAESGGEGQQAGHHGDAETDHRGGTKGKRLRG